MDKQYQQVDLGNFNRKVWTNCKTSISSSVGHKHYP